MKKKVLLASVALQAMLVLAQNPNCAVSSNNVTITQTHALMQHTPPVHEQSVVAIGSVNGRDIRLNTVQGSTNTQPKQLRINRAFPAEAKTNSAAKVFDGLQTEQPQGTLTTYGRAGRCYYIFEGMIMNNAQSGMVDIVVNQDKVYFNGIVSNMPFENSWVEGTKSGNTITVPVGQNLAYDNERGCYIKLYMMKATADNTSFEIDQSVSSITFTVDGDKISLNNSDENNIMSAVFADTQRWIGIGDFASVYTPFVDTVVVAPDGIETKPFSMVGMTDRGTAIRAQVDLGIQNSDVYIKGICYEFLPDAWVKGRKEGNKIIIPGGQYLGLYENAYNFYLVGVDETGQNLVDEITFIYDEMNGGYITDNFIVFNAYKDKIGYYSFLANVSLTETRDIPFTTDVISVQPEGELKKYSRNGTGVHAFAGSVYVSSQQGRILDMVYAPDGTTVYMKDPISRATTNDNWVKGTINGNKITMPLYQCVVFYEEDGIGMITAKMIKKTSTDPDTGQTYSTYSVDFDATEMTFTVNDNGTISLDDTENGNAAYGLIYTDDFTWTGALDYESVYTPFNDIAEEIPTGIAPEQWSYRYTDTQGNKKSAVVNVATQGESLYIQGLLHTSSHTAIVGTIQGDKVAFNSNQFMGMNQNVLVYFSGATYAKQEQTDTESGTTSYVYEFTPTDQLIFDYDATANTLTAADNTAIIYNSGKTTESLYYSQADLNPEFGYFEESAATPADPEIIEFFDDYFTEIGYSQLKLNIRTEDTQGNFINPEQLSYQLFVKRGENIEPYTLTTTNYMFLDIDMSIIPYNFTENFDIMVGGKSIRIYDNDFDDIAVRVTNNSGNESLNSNRVWAIAGVEHGSSALTLTNDNGKEVESVTFHNMNGALVANPQNGVFIKTVVYTDGSRDTFKVAK